MRCILAETSKYGTSTFLRMRSLLLKVRTFVFSFKESTLKTWLYNLCLLLQVLTETKAIMMDRQLALESSAVSKEIHGNYYLGTDNDIMLNSDFYNSSVFENATSNKSETIFRIDESEISVTRTVGRKYSIMSFVPSKRTTKVDIVVTQGLIRPAAQTDMYIPYENNFFATYDKIPKPPWFAKLCLGFVGLFVIAMMVAAIIAFVSAHCMDKGITLTAEPVVSMNFSESLKTPVPTIST